VHIEFSFSVRVSSVMVVSTVGHGILGCRGAIAPRPTTARCLFRLKL